MVPLEVRLSANPQAALLSVSDLNTSGNIPDCSGIVDVFGVEFCDRRVRAGILQEDLKSVEDGHE